MGMKSGLTICGIDIGSVSVAICEMDLEGQVVQSQYQFHNGNPFACLNQMLHEMDTHRIGFLAQTSSTPSYLKQSKKFDNNVALIAAAKKNHPGLGSLLVVGGEKFSLINFDKDGNYYNSYSNSSCAAGTGSFLDQQAKRLGLKDSAELSEYALAASGDVPKIATRCAVFAKTDLLHAQQEGYTLEAICNGLCKGLAVNIVDTLFKRDLVSGSLIFAGGVASNKAVVGHICDIIKSDVEVDEHSPFYGAIGAASLLLAEVNEASLKEPQVMVNGAEITSLLLQPEERKQYFYDPLELTKATYPEFTSLKKYEFHPQVVPLNCAVEVDIYEELPAGDKVHNLFMGIDIGSTSTKAIVIDSRQNIIAGFYTRTSGRPLRAVQAIFECIDDWQQRDSLKINFKQVGTTGAGRKFIGSVLRVDLVIDEITAHARAAYQLNPKIDTIIEIGGQDAKFTTLSNGRVTSSVMNHVCAAGTGSFIEEQAGKLGTKLADYAPKAYGARSPMASDRCTVFMERDINHFLTKGYPSNDILASILHSVRENYLQKVARNGSIGDHICFQGATAKNKALVAAFEQKLQKPIYVSKYCHLTGALGVAYNLVESEQEKSRFPGIELYKQEIPIENEVCEICANHCKLRVAKVGDEVAAYGFLCGRDYDTKKFVSNNKSQFNLLNFRKRAFTLLPDSKKRNMFTIGLPAALYMVEELPFWINFFRQLGVKTVVSDKFAKAANHGKSQASAEFCAPINAFHGHISHLADQVDYIFNPIYLEENPDQGAFRQYCYYSQFATALIPTLKKENIKQKCLTPVLKNRSNVLQIKLQLLNTLKPALGEDLSFLEISSAYEDAQTSFYESKAKLKAIYRNIVRSKEDFVVVLLGRPYTVLSPQMNKGIPDIFASLGVKTMYMDMLDYSEKDHKEIEYLLKAIHWKYAAQILKSTNEVAKTPGVYPVFITSFMCSPDSCTVEYFKRIMDEKDKPYLVLQLDEHDSSVGYETRIESAVRSFKNHFEHGETAGHSRKLPVNPYLAKKIPNKTLFLPDWDSTSCRLLAANLRNEGIDTRLIPENELTIQKSLQHNTGQCIPLNAIAQNFIEYLEDIDFDPSKAVLWTPQSNLSCNIRLYPYFVKSILEAYGNGFEKAEVYVGEISFIDVSFRASSNAYFAYMFGGLLRSMGCKVRPYEKNPGQTDQVLEEALTIFEDAFLGKTSKLDAVKIVVDSFLAIPVDRSKPRPKVALFGDLYVRDNDVMNQNLIKTIEQEGGEVITTPYTEYIKLVASAYFKNWLQNGKYFDVIANSSLLATLKKLERKYYREFERVLGPSMMAESNLSKETVVKRFGLTFDHRGESLDNLLKIFFLLEHYPDINLFVQTNPSFCCPSLITEAMAKDIEKVTHVPIVSVTYDGTLSPKNQKVIPYLKYPRKTGKRKDFIPSQTETSFMKKPKKRSPFSILNS